MKRPSVITGRSFHNRIESVVGWLLMYSFARSMGLLRIETKALDPHVVCLLRSTDGLKQFWYCNVGSELCPVWLLF